jgi:predicted DNA binding protein
MMRLRFVAPADGWARELCQVYSAYVKILGLKLAEGGKGREVAHFVEITTSESEGAGAKLKECLARTSGVRSTELTAISKDHMMGVVVSGGCTVCTSLIGTDSASFISSAATEDDCTVGYKLFLNSEGVPVLLNKLSKGGVGYKVVELSPLTNDLRLTPRQFSVLKSAMESGLYDYPRRIRQDVLATKLGIAPGTLNEILRRAEKKILGDFLAGETPSS